MNYGKRDRLSSTEGNVLDQIQTYRQKEQEYSTGCEERYHYFGGTFQQIPPAIIIKHSIVNVANQEGMNQKDLLAGIHLTLFIPIVTIIGMNNPSASTGKPKRLQALKAIASPIRQELISALGEGAASVRELSMRLGRSRQALHFHIGLLEKAGLVRTMELRGEGTGKERVYGLHHSLADFKPTDYSKRERQQAGKAAAALLRLTQRELSRAITSDTSEPPRALAIRGKARLDDAALAQVRKLISQIVDLCREAKGKNRDCPFYAVTLVLTPSSESGETLSRRGSRSR